MHLGHLSWSEMAKENKRRLDCVPYIMKNEKSLALKDLCLTFGENATACHGVGVFQVFSSVAAL